MAASDSGLDPEVVEELLALPALDRQSEFLHATSLLNAEGLDRLLDVADQLVGSDPGKAQRLAEICADVATDADAPAAVPRANYLRAQTHAINGEFDTALRFIKSAHYEYVALGENLEALRTNVGLMVVLLEQGSYEEALDVGQSVLNVLDSADEPDITQAPESYLLAALVYQNLGGCYEYMGRYDEALEAYAIAEERYQELDMTERLDEIFGNRGAILLRLGRGSEALAAYETVAAVFDKADLTLSHVKALVNIGEAHLQLGNYRRSLDAFERARRLLDSLDALAEQHILLLNTADTYLALNLYSEALAAYREADNLLQNVGMVHLRAEALWGMGSALIARSELEEAEEALAEAATIFAAAGNVPLLSGVMLEQAALMESRGDRGAALITASQALIPVSGDEWPVQRVYAHMRLADLLLPNASEAEPHLLEARRLSGALTLPHLSYRLNERLGRLRRLQGREEEARVLLEAAVDEIERLRGTVTQEAMRASFLRDKTAAYEDLLQLYLARGDEESVWRAFAVAERAKSRALVDLLTGVVETKLATPTDPELETRLQALQADLNAIYNQLLGSPGDSEYRTPLPDLHTRSTELEQEINRLRLRVAAATATPELFAAPLPLDVIREQLPTDVVLLAYHVVGDEVMAFVGIHGRIQVVRQLSTVTAVQRLLQRLTVQWDRFRVGREFAERHMTMLERSARQVLAALYTELMEPLEPLLKEAKDQTPGAADPVQKLAVVPHGLLHQVPFHALFDGRQYLLERFEISYAPSTTVFSLCQGQAPRDSSRALVFGVEDPLIPSAMAEAHAVADHFPEAEVCVGERATVSTLQSEAPGCGALHLACHGLFRAGNPMFSALKLHDGWLMATDVMDLDLTGAVVTLSACGSGRSEVIGGDEIVGLTRAFLGAGATTLVVSLWLVQDETTAALMEKWYEQSRNGVERAAALRAAQLEVKEQYPHPYYWVPFVLTGKR